MNLDDWTTRFDDYLQHQRTEARAQADYRQAEIELVADGLVRDQGLSRSDALARAKVALDDQSVLHGPDQKAGGNPKHFTGLGDGRVNSSLGSQWRARTRAARLRIEIQELLAESDIPRHLWGDVRPSISLTVA